MEDKVSKSAAEYVEIMMDKDHFSNWLGIKVIKVEKGYCKLSFKIRKEMLNGFGKVHGGVLFSGADSAFAFASNGEGRISVALDVSISFTKSAKEGDLITCEAKEVNTSYKTGLYMVELRNQEEDLIAVFKGTVYRTSKSLD